MIKVWEQVDNGSTISEVGCDGGIILKDEEIIGARITLEEGSILAKYSITCGIYGLMVHTVCAQNKEAALSKYEEMKFEVEKFLVQDYGEEEASAWCDAFVNKF